MNRLRPRIEESIGPPAIRVVGHRGAMALAPENTREAFAAAAAMGVAAIESDVRLSKDGEPALIHDATLRRTHCHPGIVGELTMAEISAIGPAPLSALLAEFGPDFDIYIDLKEKSAGLAVAVGRVVHESGAEARAWVTGSDLKQLKQVQSIAPSLRLSWAIGARHNTLSSAAVVEASLSRVSELAVVAHEVSRELVTQARSLGIDVRAYGIKSPDEARRLVGLGCRTLTLDDPRWSERLAQLSLPLLAATA